MVAGGQSNTEIARGLGVSLKTVQNHVSHVLAKLQVRDRTQAALRMRGLWPLPHGSRGGVGPARWLVHPHPPPEHVPSRSGGVTDTGEPPVAASAPSVRPRGARGVHRCLPPSGTVYVRRRPVTAPCGHAAVK